MVLEVAGSQLAAGHARALGLDREPRRWRVAGPDRMLQPDSLRRVTAQIASELPTEAIPHPTQRPPQLTGCGVVSL